MLTRQLYNILIKMSKVITINFYLGGKYLKKIVFGITSLTLGGAERVLVDIVNKLKNEYDITIFTLYKGGEFEKSVSGNIEIKSLYDMSYKNIPKLKKILISLRLLFMKDRIYTKNIGKENYDTEIAFLEGPITRLFSIKNINTKKIVWVHNDISQVFGNNLKSKIKKLYDKKVYNSYESIVFVSRDNLNKFRKIYPNIEEKKLKLIYNYIDAENIIKKSKLEEKIELEQEKINIVTVARLTKQKAIDRLINVHKKLIEDGIMHNIYVIGDGPQKELLQKQIEEVGVFETFKLLGKKENPYPYMKKANIFCLLSEYEGYGMVIEEAKILDKFIIITDTASREAVANYENSLIVDNNEKAIYNGLRKIIVDMKNETNDIHKKNNKENLYDNTQILEEIKVIL